MYKTGRHRIKTGGEIIWDQWNTEGILKAKMCHTKIQCLGGMSTDDKPRKM